MDILDHFTSVDEKIAALTAAIDKLVSLQTETIRKEEVAVPEGTIPEGTIPEGTIPDIIYTTNGEKTEDIGTINDLISLFKEQNAQLYDEYFFSYPRDGSRGTLVAGTTTFDFVSGTIKAPNGTVSNMSTGLSRLKKDFIRSVSCSGNQDIVLQFDSNDKIHVKAYNWFQNGYMEFRKLLITVPVDTEFSGIFSTNPGSTVAMAAETSISIGNETREQIDTDKDAHFTGAIATNAIESENVTGLTENKITITGVSLQGNEALDYRVWFFGTDGFANADLDTDEMNDFVELKLSGATAGRIGGAGQYYMAATGLNIDYIDLDSSNELHIALQNISAAGKTAGVAGEIKAKIMYVPRV